jgi:hypothetical protein
MLALYSALILIALGFSAAPREARANARNQHTAAAAAAPLFVAEDGDEPNEPDMPTTGEPDGPTTDDPQSDPTTDVNTRIVAAEGNTNNNWGCDTDIPGVLDMSSSEWGACCDDHDTCYETYNCTASSWSDAEQTPCKTCNDQVLACMMQKPGPGPSLCTDPANMHPCGTYRSGPP